MARKKKREPRTDQPADDEVSGSNHPDTEEFELDRNAEIEDDATEKALLELYADVQKGFQDQAERSNDQMDYWEIFFCKLGQNQYYAGNSRIYLPIIHNAVNARATRFTNQIFPVAGRYVEVTSEDGSIPSALMSLAEHYVRKAKLRTKVMPALMRNGDVEGQYNVYCSWQERERHVAYRGRVPVMIEEELINDLEGVPDIIEETILDAGPHVEVLADSDVLVLPQTADSIEEALAMGGSVTILRRWSKAKIKKELKAGNIRDDVATTMLAEMKKAEDPAYTNKGKNMIDAAGIKGEGGTPTALVYETWTDLTISTNAEDDENADERRLCKVLFGGPKQILSAKRNPNWNDKCPLISCPVEKVQGAFKGVSKVKPVAQPQYYANDAINEAADSSMYAMMPIVMTDPLKNPRIGTMVLSLSAIWETSPNDTQFAKFPELWKQGFEIVSAVKAEIAQGLSVSPAAITQTGNKTRRNQAEVAQEQQVDLLTTADAVTVIEEGVLTPVINWFIELDHQYRSEDITIPQYGPMGLRAEMERVEPVQFDTKYHFRWFGVEAARTAQQIQLQIAMTNVIRGIPPQQYEGYKLNLVPLLTQLCQNAFGPRLAPLIFESQASQMPVPVQQEEMLLLHGFEVPVNPMDDDQQHIQAHMQLLQQAQATGSVQGGVLKKIQQHVFAHMQQAQKKQMAAMQAQQGGQGMPGVPGGEGPGVAGTPRIGAMPGQPRPQGPPGMMSQDQVSPTSGGPPRMRGAA